MHRVSRRWNGFQMRKMWGRLLWWSKVRFFKKRLAGMPQWNFFRAALQKGQILGYWLKTLTKHFNPRGDNGPVRPCQKCDCNQNVDKDAIGNCDDSTGECLRCIDNTDGSHCEVCKAGFFGDALALKKVGDPPSCQVCQCYPIGTNHDETTLLPVCSPFTGDCSCKPQVVGRDCDRLVWFEIWEQVFKSLLVGVPIFLLILEHLSTRSVVDICAPKL